MQIRLGVKGNFKKVEEVMKNGLNQEWIDQLQFRLILIQFRNL